MTVKEVSKLLKIPVSSLHYYENEKLINPKRDKNNYRIFTKEDIMKMKYILILKNFNFPFILNKKYDIISNENSNKSKDIKNINYC